MQIQKPPHKKYLLHNVDIDTYRTYYNGYSKAKRLGFRATATYLTGQGICHIAWELGKGQLICYGKRKLGYAILGGISWVAGPVLPIVTNSTKVLKVARFVHRTSSEVLEISENGCCAMLYALDMIVFGQGVPVGKEGRFNIMDSVTCTDLNITK